MLKFFVSLILFASATINVALAVPASKDNKPSVPADLFYEFKPVPNDENAIINWRRGAEVEVALNDKEKQIIKFCWTPAAREPSANDLDDLQTWLKRNKEA